jgi:hypothetical protein
MSSMRRRIDPVLETDEYAKLRIYRAAALAHCAPEAQAFSPGWARRLQVS